MGILTFDRPGKIIRAINKAGGLRDNTVTGLLLDRSDDLWATTNAGISHIELSVPQSVLGAGSGIDGVSISACFHDGRGEAIHKACSIDCTSFPVFKEHPGLLTFEQTIMAADLALFHAKHPGRKQCVCLRAGPRTPSWAETIQTAVASLEFALREGFLQVAPP